MAINVVIAPDSPEQESKSITVNIEQPSRVLHFELNVRRALNGDLMIFDHKDIDIIIMMEKKKIVAFAKDLMSEVVYGAESRLFEHLRKKGIVAFDSIQGGNVYGSLEGQILDSKELDAIKASLYEISNWMNEEKPYFASIDGHDEMMDDALLTPDEESSTELGEVPHEEEKGSIMQRGIFAPYMYRHTY